MSHERVIDLFSINTLDIQQLSHKVRVFNNVFLKYKNNFILFRSFNEKYNT